MRVIQGGGEASEEDVALGIHNSVRALTSAGLPWEEAVATVAARVAAYSLTQGTPPEVIFPRAVRQVIEYVRAVERR